MELNLLIILWFFITGVFTYYGYSYGYNAGERKGISEGFDNGQKSFANYVCMLLKTSKSKVYNEEWLSEESKIKLIEFIDDKIETINRITEK